MTPLTLSAVATRLAVGHATVRRWVTRGVNGHRLTATRAGGHWRVTEAELAVFLEKLHPGGAVAAVPMRTLAQERADSERADRELELAGW